MSTNNNQSLIDGLRQAADLLESKPEFPAFSQQRITLWCWNDKELLRHAARHLGSFTKEFTTHYFELHRRLNEAVSIEVLIDREQICKKIVTWDCPDDESLLKLVNTDAEDCARIGEESHG